MSQAQSARRVLATDPETFGLTALVGLFFGFFGWQMGRKTALSNSPNKNLVSPSRAGQTISNPSLSAPSPATTGKRPDEVVSTQLSDELSKMADEGTLGKK
ncbi:hypothetical protein DFJ74DRAFT_706556 [Hyaloraphidium curvatum]|nr:hypothetical protein DFJ74DRAFT_706556 [Hyaloraphidium curvatum]